MKKIKMHLMIILLMGLVMLSGCSSKLGGTETGTTESGMINTQELGNKIEAASNKLVLAVNNSNINASVSSSMSVLIDGTSDEWSIYIDPDNAFVLTDIFGAPDEDPQVVTKIRVLLEEFEISVENTFEEDPDILCTGGVSLTEGDTLEIPFYGEVSNGSADDRFFECLQEEGDQITLYGRDANQVIRLVTMFDTTIQNTDQPDTRGDTRQIKEVIFVVYAEQTEEEEELAYLDLQYAQITLYNGVDDTFDSEDDIIFKSRSRITGRTILDELGEPSEGMGDFIVTKYDKGENSEAIVTKTFGRGSFETADYSLLNIDSDEDAIEDMEGTFCIQIPEDGSAIPTYADSTNCRELETSYAWTDTSFPFDLSPAIEEVFDEKIFFEGNNIDLISDNGSNFTIPTYETE